MNSATPEALRSPLFAPKLTLRHFLTQRWVIAVISGLGLGGLALALLSPPVASSAVLPGPSSPPLPVRAFAVEGVSGYTTARVFSGEIHARRTSELGFQIDGEVIALAKDEGDHVRAGEVLATLDLRKRRAERARMTARLAEERARLAELEAGPRKQTIAAARERVSELEHRLELAERRRDRRDFLVQERVATEEELDDASTEAEALEDQLDAARETLDELLEGTRKEQLAAQRAVVDQLTAALESLDVDLSNGILRAPYDALVAARYVDEGHVLAAGTPVLRLVEDALPEVRVGVPIDVATTLESGRSLSLEAGRVPFQGTLRAVLPEVDVDARTATLVIDVDATAPTLLPRQVVRLRLEKHEDAQGFWVPTSALTRGTRGLWVAYALGSDEPSGGQAVEARDLEVLFTEGERTLVRGVLREGDRIVAEGLNRIVPGQIVRAAE